MKIIVSAPLIPPAINGTTIFAKQISNNFNAVITGSNALDWIALHSSKGKTHNNGFNIRLIRNLSNPRVLAYFKEKTNGLLNAFINGPISRELLHYLINTDSDVIHSLTLPYLNNYYSLWASRLSGKKSVITPFFIKNIVKESHKKLLSKFDLVLASTNYEKNALKLSNTRVLPMSVNTKLFTKANGNDFKEKYGINGKMVLFVGNANYYKGAYSLLEASKRVNATFVFMGPHTSGFKSRAKKLSNVKLINPQLRNKFDAFAACDVYAMPSIIEAFGITYLEAWACSKPVIAADTPVSREVIGKNGLLVEFGNTNQLVNAINKALISDGLGRSGYERLINNFTERRVMSLLRSYYEELITY